VKRCKIDLVDTGLLSLRAVFCALEQSFLVKLPTVTESTLNYSFVSYHFCAIAIKHLQNCSNEVPGNGGIARFPCARSDVNCHVYNPANQNNSRICYCGYNVSRGRWHGI